MYGVPLLKIGLISFIVTSIVVVILFILKLIDTDSILEIMVASIGLAPIFVSFYLIYIIYLHTKWIKHKATVVSINIVSKATEAGDKFIGQGDIVPIIKYTYTIDGKQYMSNRLGVFENDYGYELDKDIDDFINKYFSKKEVTMWFNPKKPSESILLQGCSKTKLTTIVGYILIGLFIIICVSYMAML